MREHLGLKILLLLIAIIFVAHQLYSSFYKPIGTETAEYFEVVSGVSAQGVIIRSEKIITNDTSGALHYITTDGTRAAKGGKIAEIYSDSSISGKISRMHTIESELDSISQIEEYNNVMAPDMDIVGGKVNDSLNALIRAGATGNYETTPELFEQFIMNVNRRQVLTGEITDFTAKKEALSKELKELESSIPAATGKVVAETSGYFVSSVDGYEQVLTTKDLSLITPEFLEKVKPEAQPENAIGKIVSDYEWYIAAEMGINDSLKYKEGDTLTIKTAVKSAPELSVTVNCINMAKDNNSAVVVFSCQQMNGDLAKMRRGPITVVDKVYRGLKLSKKDLRVVDGVTGVYTVSGMRLKFVPVNVLYSTEDFIICEQQISEKTVLRLYDEVVVKGKGLYDGKVIS
ncbi:MAG: hypothetical protein J5852_07125 [Clostridia bacterium]|nr:hypothetical protein [Clostridia bacterium]